MILPERSERKDESDWVWLEVWQAPLLFLEHAAELWILRTNQVGGANPDILPLAPTSRLFIACRAVGGCLHVGLQDRGFALGDRIRPLGDRGCLAVMSGWNEGFNGCKAQRSTLEMYRSFQGNLEKGLTKLL